MKIGIDARFYGSEHKGLGRYTTNILHALSRADKKTSYIVFINKKYSSKLSLSPNFTLVPCNIPHYSLHEQLLLPGLIKQHQIDIFYTFHLNAPIFTKARLVVTIHDLIKSHFTSIDTTTRPTPIFFLKRFSYNILIRKVLRRAEKIIVPSQFVKQDLMDSFHTDPNKIHPIHEAPDSIFTKKNVPSKIPSPRLKTKKYLLFVGNSYPHKNLATLIKAFTVLSAQSPDLLLVLVSENNPFLKKILSPVTSSVKNKIILLSNLSDQELYWLYKHALATITPSLMEGFGLVGMESLSLGTPVIASNIPVYKEVYRDLVTYIDPHNYASIVGAVQDYLDNPPPRKSHNFKRTWDDVVHDVIGVFREISSSL